MIFTLYFFASFNQNQIHFILFGHAMTLQFYIKIILENIEPPFEFIFTFVFTFS